MKNTQNIPTEALLPLVTELTDKYTSKDSTSVSYETARMLMQAVLYTIREWEEGIGTNSLAPYGKEQNLNQAYQQGYQHILKKTYQAKTLYETILQTFRDYRCQNYHDTILDGIPAFFTKYDPRFCPQDHILTLDYPALSIPSGNCGIDLILDYLTGIHLEQTFLSRFSQNAVIKRLERLHSEYESLYLDNICKPVLLTTIACVIAQKPAAPLQLDSKDILQIKAYFTGNNKSETEHKIKEIIQVITAPFQCPEMTTCFIKAAKDYAAQIHHALQTDTLELLI